MASVRCGGLESAANIADQYNFFTADGTTLFQKSGNEYRRVFGAWDVTATPGVTARQGMDKLTPVTNWSGYCSKFNFAGAATNGGVNAVAGFIFQKMNGADRTNVSNTGTNATLYGVKAHKSYFMLGDYFVALGAGITNLNPTMAGTIRTTIDQTAKTDDVQIISNGLTRPVGVGIQNFTENGKPVWVVQKNKFAYSILPEYSKNAYFITENLKTDWVKMNSSNSAQLTTLPANVDMLRLWIDHGQNVVNGTYGYVVYAGADVPNASLPFTVLQNDTLVQAIQSTDQKITEVVLFTQTSQLNTTDITLSASAPCVILIESKGNEKLLSVSDPQMDANLKQIQIVLNGETFVVDMPQGKLCGQPVTRTISNLSLTKHTADQSATLSVYGVSDPTVILKLNKAARVSIDVLSLNGSYIQSLISDKNLSEGNYNFKIENLLKNRGIYLVRLMMDGKFIECKKIIL